MELESLDKLFIQEKDTLTTNPPSARRAEQLYLRDPVPIVMFRATCFFVLGEVGLVYLPYTKTLTGSTGRKADTAKRRGSQTERS